MEVRTKLDGKILTIDAKQSHKGRTWLKIKFVDDELGPIWVKAFGLEAEFIINNLSEGSDLKASADADEQPGEWEKEYIIKSLDPKLLSQHRTSQSSVSVSFKKQKLSVYMLEGMRSYGYKRVPADMRYVGGLGKIACSWIPVDQAIPVGNQVYDGILFTRWVTSLEDTEFTIWDGEIYPKEIESKNNINHSITNCPF